MKTECALCATARCSPAIAIHSHLSCVLVHSSQIPHLPDSVPTLLVCLRAAVQRHQEGRHQNHRKHHS